MKKGTKIFIGVAILGIFCLGLYWSTRIAEQKQALYEVQTKQTFTGMLGDGFQVEFTIEHGLGGVENHHFIVKELLKLKHDDVYGPAWEAKNSPKLDTLLKHLQTRMIYSFTLRPVGQLPNTDIIRATRQKIDSIRMEGEKERTKIMLKAINPNLYKTR